MLSLQIFPENLLIPIKIVSFVGEKLKTKDYVW